MRGEEFLLVGKSLAQNPLSGCSSEAQCRTAIGRAYYAAFLALRDGITQTERRITYPPTAKSHELLCHDINNCGDRDAKAYAKIIGDLRTARNSADYETILTDANENIGDKVDYSLQLAEQCMKWFAAPGQAFRVAAGVLVYRKKTNQI